MKTNSPTLAHPSNQNILIVGGGHVGLSFALLLAHHGIYSTLLERQIYPKINPNEDDKRQHYLDSRNTALSRRTVQIYQEIDLWQDLQSHACRIDGVQISEQGGFGQAFLDKDQEGVESFGQVMENAWLGRKLLLAVKNSPFITLIEGANITHLTQNVQKVSIQYQQKDDKGDLQNQTLQASLLVACDGRDSVCRQLLKIGAKTYDYQQTAIVGVVQTDQPHHHIAIERFGKAGPLAVLPLTDKAGSGNLPNQHGLRKSVVWICKKGDEKPYLEDERQFLQALQKAFGTQAGQFLQAGKRGAYPLTKVVANQQVKGRCVLMGNAAHTLHPVAGQGFNLCLRDAHALARLIAQQIQQGKEIAEPRILQAYEKSRKQDQKRVEHFCDAVVFGFMPQNRLLKTARNLGLIAFDKLPKIKPLVAHYAMGLKY